MLIQPHARFLRPRITVLIIQAQVGMICQAARSDALLFLFFGDFSKTPAAA